MKTKSNSDVISMRTEYIKQLKIQNKLLILSLIVMILVNLIELWIMISNVEKVKKFYYGRAFTFSYPSRVLKIDGKIYTGDDFVLDN